MNPSLRTALTMWCVSLGCITALSGCTPANIVHTDIPRSTASHNEVPVSANFRTSNQFRLQAAQHWANIADDTGKAISSLLQKKTTCVPGAEQCASIFINPPSQVTEFSRAFHNQLLTTLVTSGLNISKTPKSAVLIDIDVQPIVFSPNRPQYRYAGVATELGPGIWALRDVSSMSPADPTNAPPDQDALHWFRTEFSAGKTPQMEILVTVSAGTSTHYLARTTNVYYVTEGDRRLYDQEICSLISPCGTTGSKATPEPSRIKTRKIGVTGDCPLEKVCCPADQPCEEPETKNAVRRPAK